MTIAAQLIREARLAARLTMAELAERAGTSKPTLSRYENGLVDPGAETLNRLLRACGQELRTQPVGLPSSLGEVAERFEGCDGPTTDDVTRTRDGRALRTAADLEAYANELRRDGLLAASLDDIIDSKTNADRPKDREALPELRRLRQRLRGNPGG